MRNKIRLLVALGLLSSFTACSSGGDGDQPTPAETTCDSNNLSQCTNTDDCTDAEGFWYDDKCNEDAVIIPPSCDSANLNLCSTDSECTSATGYWYNSSCHSNASSKWNEMNWNEGKWQ